MLRNLNPEFAQTLRECKPGYLEDTLTRLYAEERAPVLKSVIDVARALATHPEASREQRHYPGACKGLTR